MLNKFRRFIRKYSFFTTVVLGLGLSFGLSSIHRYGISHLVLVLICSATALAASKKAYETLQHGYFGIHVLPITGIFTALILRELWTGALLALLLTLEKPLLDYLQVGAKNLQVARHSRLIRLLDKATLPFVIMVVLIGGVIWIISGDSSRFLNVIAGASTAPLLLAAPIVVVVGMRRARDLEIGCTSAVIFEKLSNVQTIILRKTGVLTTKDSEVSSVKVFGNHTKDSVIRVASALAGSSEHHLAQAITRYANENQKVNRAKHVHESSGMGIAGRMKGNNLVIGRLSFLESQNVVLPKQITKTSEPAVYVAQDNDLIGFITFKEQLEDGARNLNKKLKKLGVTSTELVSGSTYESVQIIAGQVGIKTWHSDVSPSDVIKLVENAARHPVAFVGDESTDAPIMTAADVAITQSSVGSSNHVNIPDFSIEKLLITFSLARRTFNKSFLVSLVGLFIALCVIVVSASGVLKPMQAAALNIFVSVVVVLVASAKGSLVKRLQ